MLLFLGMESPLLGMGPKPAEKRSERTADSTGQDVTATTEQNRRSAFDEEDNDPNELTSSFNLTCVDNNESPFIKRNPKRLSSEIAIQKQGTYRKASTNITDRDNAEIQIKAKRAELIDRFLHNQSLLEKEQVPLQKAILEQQKMVENLTALRAARGFPYTLCSSEKRNIGRKKIYHQLVASLQHRVTNYRIGSEWLLSYLPKRDALFGQFKSTSPLEENNQLQQTVAKAITDTQQIGQLVLDDFCSSETSNINSHLKLLSDEELSFINTVIDLVRDMQFFFLGYHSSSYITMSKEKLAEVEKALETKIQELNQDKDLEPEIKTRYLAAQELFENNKAELLLMETISARETISAAANNTATISQAMQETKEAVVSTQLEIDEARPENKKTLESEMLTIEDLHNHLLNAMLSYLEIQDEACIEKRCGNLNTLHDQITLRILSITQEAIRLKIPNSATLSTQLNDLLNQKNLEIDKPLEVPQGPLEFLDELNSLDSSLAKKRIIGTHGKIALDDASSSPTTTYSEQARREWTSGIDLIRLAICRTRGIQHMQKFTETIAVKIREQNSLKVDEVINFLFDDHQQPKYPSSFFVDLKISHEDFLKKLSAPHADKRDLSDKVIKIDQATLDFNPFNKKTPNLPYEDIATADLRQREAGFQYVREALKKAFPEAFLTNEEMNEVLHKFDEGFKVTSEGIPLTLEKAHTFIEDERQILKARGCWQKHVARYLGQEGTQNMLNGLYYSIGTHILPVALGIVSYLYYLSLTHALA